jgi:hypothetical protein
VAEAEAVVEAVTETLVVAATEPVAGATAEAEAAVAEAEAEGGAATAGSGGRPVAHRA